jgi:hypothetical protein
MRTFHNIDTPSNNQRIGVVSENGKITLEAYLRDDCLLALAPDVQHPLFPMARFLEKFGQRKGLSITHIQVAYHCHNVMLEFESEARTLDELSDEIRNLAEFMSDYTKFVF